MTTQTAPAPPRIDAPAPSAPAPASLLPADDAATAAGAGATPAGFAPDGFTLDIRSLLAILPDDDALDDWFLRFAADNEHLGVQFEIDRKGRLIAMASEKRGGAERQFNLQFDLQVWINAGAGGKALIGNEIVRMPGRARRAADAGWLAPDQIAGMPPVSLSDWTVNFPPRFVAEIRSISNSVEQQQAKMEEWLDYGVALGWLIDPFLRQVHIYRPGIAPQLLDDPETISGDPELPSFVFAVRRRIFDLP